MYARSEIRKHQIRSMLNNNNKKVKGWMLGFGLNILVRSVSLIQYFHSSVVEHKLHQNINNSMAIRFKR